MPDSDRPILSAVDLRIERGDGSDIVAEASFDVTAGATLAIVGESGCGKTSTALALLGHARPGTRITGGAVLLGGQDVLRLGPGARRRLRGSKISYVPQDPGSSLNPRHRIGRQIAEALQVHGRSRGTAAQSVAELLSEVGLPGGETFRRRYPFELSGGQQQRVAIAMALACKPLAVVLDEPTTGLDVSTQARILDLLKELGRATRVAFVYVTHDLAVVDQIATEVAVMYAGRIVEAGARDAVLHRPAHPYTRLLVSSVPRLRKRVALVGIAGTAPAPAARPAGCFFAPRCPLSDEHCRLAFPPAIATGPGRWARCWHPAEAFSMPAEALPAVSGAISRPLLAVSGLSASYGAGRTRNHVIRDIHLDVGSGECLALVGESGSGKSTIGRCVAGLHRPDAGRLVLSGNQLAPHAAERRLAELKAVQLIFQNPERSLNPRETVEAAILRAIRHFETAGAAGAGKRVVQQLDRVRLPADALHRYPAELSGGEKQRVAIARALAADPELLICDEITSALDVSTQAAIVRLLAELRADGLALLFITHNLALVRAIADRVLVLQAGEAREIGPADDIIDAPAHPYTKALLAASPELTSLET